MTKLYVNTEGLKLKVNCGDNLLLTAATGTKIKAKKPSGEIIDFPATVEDDHYLTYTTTETDIDEAGEWKFQAEFTLASWTGPGETKILKFYERFK